MNRHSFRSLSFIILSLLLLIPLGLATKTYSGMGQQWINDYAGDILYEIFWCLFFFAIFYRKTAIDNIAILVFTCTCAIETAQLWSHPWLQTIRSSLLGRLLLGTTFSWWDFPHYLIGSVCGWLWLRLIWQHHQSRHIRPKD